MGQPAPPLCGGVCVLISWCLGVVWWFVLSVGIVVHASSDLDGVLSVSSFVWGF